MLSSIVEEKSQCCKLGAARLLRNYTRPDRYQTFITLPMRESQPQTLCAWVNQ